MDSNFNNQNNQPDYSQQPQQPQQADPQVQYQQQYYQQAPQQPVQQQAYYQQPQQAYYQAQPQYYQQMVPQEVKPIGKAVASMVLGILSIIACCFFPYVTLFTSLIGMILAIVSLKKNDGGKGMAIAGLICSILALVYSAVITAVLVVIFIQAKGDINEVYEILEDLKNL